MNTSKNLDSLENREWFGQMIIAKPRKNEKIGIPMKPWHHLAFIEDFVLLYVWNTREIQDAFPVSEVLNWLKLETEDKTVTLNDNFKELHLGPSSTTRAKTIVKTLLTKHPFLPIFDRVNMQLQDIKMFTEELRELVTEYAEDNDFIIGDGVRVLAIPHGMIAESPVNMFKASHGRYICRELYTGRQQEFFTQAKLFTIISIVERITNTKFDYNKLIESKETLLEKVEKAAISRAKAQSKIKESKNKESKVMKEAEL